MPAEDAIAGMLTKLADIADRVAKLERLETSSYTAHAPVTLDANSVQVNSLTGQELGLQVQVHNFPLIGPETGAPAIPTFRAMVFGDIPSSSNPGAAAAILATDASGYLRLVGLGIGGAPTGTRLEVWKDTGGTYDSTTVGALFGDWAAGQADSVYTVGNTVNYAYGHDNDASSGWLNYRGYQGGVTRFRDLAIGDGKGTAVVFVDGSIAAIGVGTTDPDGFEVDTAVTETAQGRDNVRFGVASGTPRAIFEDGASGTLWEIDNYAGTMRFFHPASVNMSLAADGTVDIGASLGGTLDVSGTLYALLTGGAPGTNCYYNTTTKEIQYTSSTRAVKTAIRDAYLFTQRVLALTPRAFNWRLALGGQSDLGLIAEEVADVSPLFAAWGPRKQYREDGSMIRDEHNMPIEDKSIMVPEAIRWDMVTLHLLALAQEHEARICALEGRIA